MPQVLREMMIGNTCAVQRAAMRRRLPSSLNEISSGSSECAAAFLVIRTRRETQYRRSFSVPTARAGRQSRAASFTPDCIASLSTCASTSCGDERSYLSCSFRCRKRRRPLSRPTREPRPIASTRRASAGSIHGSASSSYRRTSGLSWCWRSSRACRIARSPKPSAFRCQRLRVACSAPCARLSSRTIEKVVEGHMVLEGRQRWHPRQS